MNDVQDPVAPPRRLTRSSDDRMVAGVCGGLAAYTGLDPVIFRVAIAVATVAGGSGLLAYAIAWLVIPSAEEGESHADALLRRRQVPRPLLIAGAVLVAAILVGAVDGFGDRHWGGGGLGLVGLIAVGVWLATRDRAIAPPPVPPAPPQPARPFTSSDAETTAVLDTPPPPPPPPPPIPRPESKLSAVTVSVLLLVAGFLALLQVTGAAEVAPEVGLAVGLLVVGAGLLVGSWYGRARPLIAAGLVLTVLTAATTVADVPFAGGVGERVWHPRAAADLAQPYRLGAGEAVLDLTDLELGAGTHRAEASVGMGHLRVRLPDDGPRIRIRAHAGAGEVRVLERREDGVDVSTRTVLEGSGAAGDALLVLDLRTGLGQLEVTR